MGVLYKVRKPTMSVPKCSVVKGNVPGSFVLQHCFRAVLFKLCRAVSKSQAVGWCELVGGIRNKMRKESCDL